MSSVAVKEQPADAFQRMEILREDERKANFIVVRITHHPESVEKIAEIARANRINTIILENSPKELIDALEGRKTPSAHAREFILSETKGKLDIEKEPEYLLEPRLASYKRRCEVLCEMKKQNPNLNVIIVDPYYERNALGPQGETYEERMGIQRREKENMERIKVAQAIKDFAGAVENAKAVAKELAQEIRIGDAMRAKAIAEGGHKGNVLIEIGEGHELFEKELSRSSKNVSVIFANKEIIEKVFKAENNHPPLLQLAHKYLINEPISKETEDLLAARACAATAMFSTEMQRMVEQGKRMTAEQDYKIIKAANELSFDDCKKIFLG